MGIWTKQPRSPEEIEQYLQIGKNAEDLDYKPNSDDDPSRIIDSTEASMTFAGAYSASYFNNSRLYVIRKTLEGPEGTLYRRKLTSIFLMIS